MLYWPVASGGATDATLSKLHELANEWCEALKGVAINYLLP